MKNTKVSPDSLIWVHEFMRSTQTTTETACSDYSLAKNPGIKCCPIMSCPYWISRLGSASSRSEHNHGRNYGRGDNDMSQEEISQAMEQARTRIENLVFNGREGVYCCVIPT